MTSTMKTIVFNIFLYLFLFFNGVTHSTAKEYDFRSKSFDVKIYHTELPQSEGQFYVLVEFLPKNGWYTYWQNPGDTGMPPRVSFHLPEGSTYTLLEYPTPSLHKSSPFTTYVYKTKTIFVYQVNVPFKILPKDVRLDLNWLACKETCLPQSFETTLENKAHIPLKDAQEIVDHLPNRLFQGYVTQKNKSLIFSGDDSFDAIKEAYFFPKHQEFIVTDAEQKISSATKGFTLTLPLLNAREKAEGIITVKDHANNTFSYIVDHTIEAIPQAQEENWFWIFAIAVFGGLILNLMPCVFPVLSIKILSLLKAELTRKGLMRHGLSYAAGIFSSFMILIITLNSLKQMGYAIGWGFQLQSPLFITFLIFIFFLMSLNLFSLYEILPPQIHLGIENKNPLKMSFLNGMLTTLVATPCTAPFMGVSLSLALNQSFEYSFLIFLGLSLGLALPFILLCLQPNLLKKLPKPGPWMETIKHLLALPLLGAIVWLIWVIEALNSGLILPLIISLLTTFILMWIYGCSQKRHTPFLSKSLFVYLIFFITAFYQQKNDSLSNLFYGSIPLVLLYIGYEGYRSRNDKQRIKQLFFSVFLGSFLSIGYLPLIQSLTTYTVTPQENASYDLKHIEAALEKGQTVFINYTARWCITCQINKMNVLSRPNIQKAFKTYNILYVEADWTNHNKEITQSLRKLGRTSIPVYAFLSKKRKEPLILPEILTEEMVLDALSKLHQPSS